MDARCKEALTRLCAIAAAAHDGAVAQAQTLTSDHLWPIATLSPQFTSRRRVLDGPGSEGRGRPLFRQLGPPKGYPAPLVDSPVDESIERVAL
jgi:hypothetical protein